jgi:hypothetical protein
MTSGFEQHRGPSVQPGVSGVHQQPGSGNPSPQHQPYAGHGSQQQQQQPQPGGPGAGAYAAPSHGPQQVSNVYGQQVSLDNLGSLSA